MENLPVKLDSLFSFSFQFDNLIKIIQFLHKNNTTLTDEVSELKRQVSVLNELKSQVTSLEIKQKTIDKNLKETNQSLSSHQRTLLEHESKTQSLIQQLKTLTETTTSHEDNLNNLNRVLEDHIKSSKDIESKIKEMETNMLQLSVQFDKDHSQFTDVTQTIKRIERDLDKNIVENNQKHNDIDKTFTNIIKSLSDITASTSSSSSNNNNNNTDRTGQQQRQRDNNTSQNQNANSLAIQLETAQHDIDELKTQLQTQEQKISEYHVANDTNINNIHGSIHNINEKLSELIDMCEMNTDNNTKHKQLSSTQDNNTSNTNNNNNNNTTQVSNISVSAYDDIIKLLFNTEQFRLINENIRIISNTIGNKVNKDELDSLNRSLLSKIEKISDKVTESLKFYDNKLKHIKGINSSHSGTESQVQNMDLNYFTQTIETQINDQIKHSISSLLQQEIPHIDFTQNPQLNDLFLTSSKHTDELNETYKSIVDIRSSLVSNELLNDIQSIKGRLDYNEEDNRRIKYRLSEVAKIIDGDDDDPNDKGSNTNASHINQGTFREKLILLNTLCHNLSDKVAVLEKKSQLLSKEVKDDVKASLKNETAKVIDQFKLKLDSFTNKFEHELKNKIDLMGLTSFEHKMNNRFYIEMRDKLDRNELRKNNSLINRKIDSLENKISKTLVDTIIDLQMDEAPLIVKKNLNNVEKCASCNQVLPQMNSPMYYSNDKFRSTRYNVSNKLPEINEKNNN